MATERKLPVTVGTITILDCVYQPLEDRDDPEAVDSFPEFLITGKVRQKDGEHDFVRKVAVELDGRNADHEHVSGLDLDEIGWDSGPFERGQVDEDLYNALYGTPAYGTAAEAYHGGPV
jgi:hypothetical protein